MNRRAFLTALAALPFAGKILETFELARIPAAYDLVVDWSKGNVQHVRLWRARKIRFARPRRGSRYVLVLEQPGESPRTITWPKSVKWAGGAAPTLTGKKEIVSLIRAGRHYYATSQRISWATSCAGR